MKLFLIFSSLFFASGFNINFLQNPIVEKPIKQCPEYLEKYVVPLKDEYLIHNLLDNNFIDIAHKKQIILWLIEQTMNGDAMGGKILDLYYDIVNCLL